MRKIIIIATIIAVCLLAIATPMMLQDFNVAKNDGFELIIHGSGGVIHDAYRFVKIDDETLVVYFGLRRGANLREYGVEEFIRVARHEKKTLTPEESRELMRLVREVKEDAPKYDGFMVLGGAWYAILIYNGVYYTAPFAPPIASALPSATPRPLFDNGASMIDLMNKLVELSPLPVHMRRPHGGS